MSRRTWVLVALLIGVCFFLPSKSHAIERDPYLIRTLIARIQFEYEKRTVTENGRKGDDESRFKQTYSLDTRGNLLSRYLIIYDAGASFSNDDYTSGTTNFATNNYDYNLRTTFLPLSAVPLTLYGRYNNQTFSGLRDDLWSTRLTYGLNWFSTIRPFPKTMLTVERGNDKTNTTDTLTTYVRVRANKELGPTENEVEYVYRNNDNQKSSDVDTSSDVNFRNKTHLSKNTNLYIGATRSESKTKADSPTNPRTTHITLQGLSLNLNSRPSREFNQTHNYNFFSSKTDGTNTGSNYSGDLNYSFSDRLNSHLGLSYSENEDETPTSQSKSQTVSTNDSIRYRLTRNLSISETISYTRTATNALAGTGTNVGGQSSFRLTTAVSYGTGLPFADLGVSYSLSYSQENLAEEADGKGGKGIQQDVSVGLGNIDVTPHVGFNTSAHFTSIKNLSGDIGGRDYGYEASAFNKSLRKYIQITGIYSKETTESWINILDQRKELYRLTVTSEYFRNTRMRGNAEHVNDFSSITGFTNTATQDLAVDHTRGLLGGALTLSASFSRTTARSLGEPQRVFSKIYQARYSRPILRAMLWQLSLSRNEKTERTTFTNVTSAENSIFLPLRSWLFSLDHLYTLTEDNRRERAENRLMLKASRAFFRVY